MAKDVKKSSKRANRPQGQLAQMWTVYKMTAQADRTSVLWSALAFLVVLGGIDRVEFGLYCLCMGIVARIL